MLLPSVARAEGEVYRIGPGDVVEVQVWREPDLSGRFTIDASGSMPHVLAGPVPAQGATLVELRDRLKTRLESEYLREARVGVSLVESARRKASVLGAVAAPGQYPLGEETRVLELLFNAGGVTEQAAAWAILTRFSEEGPTESEARVQERIRIDLAALLERGDLRQNAPVRPGDVLVVETRTAVSAAPDFAASGRVRVVGEVEQPGVYSIEEAPTLLDAVLAAGGLAEFASGNRARLVRGLGADRHESRVRLGDLLDGKAGAENPVLEDGDLVVVPESFF